MEWYETPPEQRNEEQKRRCQQAYYLVLLSTKEGREVVCDFKRRANEMIDNSAFQRDCAVAQLWLEAFYEDTITMCGVDNCMQLVEAQQQIARGYIHKEEQPDTPEDFAE